MNLFVDARACNAEMLQEQADAAFDRSKPGLNAIDVRLRRLGFVKPVPDLEGVGLQGAQALLNGQHRASPSRVREADATGSTGAVYIHAKDQAA